MPTKKGTPKRKPQARWWNPEHTKRHALTVAKVGDKRDHEATMRVARTKGLYVDPSDQRQPLAAFAPGWLAEVAVSHPKGNTAALRESAWRVHLEPALGHVPVGNLTVTICESVLARLKNQRTGEPLSPNSLLSVRHSLSSLLKYLLDLGVRTTKPLAPNLANKRPKRKKLVPLTMSQVMATRGLLPERYRLIVDLQAFAGLRLGEALGLRMEDVDFLPRRLHVQQQWTRAGVATETKNEVTRYIPVGRLLDAINVHATQWPTPDGAPLLSAPDGSPLSHNVMKNAYPRAFRRAGVTGTSHDLRHFYAAEQLARGMSMEQLAQVLGDSLMTVIRYYNHLHISTEDAARKNIDAAYAEWERSETDAERTQRPGLHAL